MDKNTKLNNNLANNKIKTSTKDINLNNKNNNSNSDTNPNDENLNNIEESKKLAISSIATTSAKIIFIFLEVIMGFILVGIFLLSFALSINEIAEKFKEFTTLYPLAFLTIGILLSLLILYLILKRFFKKQKILLAFTILIALTLIFIRTIPDYFNKYGISLTTIFGKEKYKQGYCLKEDRILLKEELYKRVATQFLEKYKDINRKVTLIENHCKKIQLNITTTI